MPMRIYTKRMTNLALLALVLVLCQGCDTLFHPTTSVESVKAPEYAGSMKRLFVASSNPMNAMTSGTNQPIAGGAPFVTNAAFYTSMSNYMQSCGIAFGSIYDNFKQPQGNNGLANASPSTYNFNYGQAMRQANRPDLLQQFAPDTILELSNTGVTGSVPRTGPPVLTNIAVIKFDATLIDAVSKNKIWRAQIELYPRNGTVEKDGQVLAHDILQKMKQDGLLASCPAVN